MPAERTTPLASRAAQLSPAQLDGYDNGADPVTQTPVGEAGSDGLPALLPWGVCGGAATPPRDAIKTRVSGNAGIAAAGQEGQAPGPKQAQVGVTAGQQPRELGGSWTHPEDELQLLLPGVRMHFALKPPQEAKHP